MEIGDDADFFLEMTMYDFQRNEGWREKKIQLALEYVRCALTLKTSFSHNRHVFISCMALGSMAYLRVS